MSISIRKSKLEDLAFLVSLEQQAFDEFQRNNKKSLALSLKSPFQEVWIIESEELDHKPIGSMTLFLYKKSLRVYSVAVLKSFQNKGIGSSLIKHLINIAHSRKVYSITLEAHSKNLTLIEWYQKRGFKILNKISDYYGDGEDCVKMELILKEPVPIDKELHKVKNLIVVNQPRTWQFKDINAKIISVREYISNEEYHSNSSYRIFNLCTSYQYQSYGYYVSLLASARGQRVIPDITTIRDFSSIGLIRSISSEINDIMQSSLKLVNEKHCSINVYFGQTNINSFKKIAFKLYQLFETPLFTVSFIKDENWMIKKIQPLNLNKISEEEFLIASDFAKKYFNKKRFNKTRLISYKYDLAILINQNEATPPSDAKALNNFKIAANKKGIYTEFISKNNFDRINEFDALFIRETTNVNDHTYEISRLAYSEGLVVLDDPWSILRCSNKIYQNELFKQNKILTPKTITLTKNLFQESDLDNANFPLVLKQPDSAFSLGVSRAKNKEEAITILNHLFKKSDMIISQEFLYSEFDWRIGILDNLPLFACKYYMTPGHWQIYNWEGKAEEFSGNFETLAISAVPQKVLDTALKAASLIGDSLYGVDLKEIDGKVYVIEVNDNPNIDAGIEDAFLKNALYDRIIESIYNRIDLSKNVKHFEFTK